MIEVRAIERNRVIIAGDILSDFTYSHELYGEKFYIVKLSAQRESGTTDIIPVMVSDRLIDTKKDWCGKRVEIKGQFRSYNKRGGEKNRLILSVFARELEEDEELPFSEDCNHIYLDGFICKKPNYRNTPFGRKISDILLAVNRPYRKSDYIPCICWGRNARFASTLEVGTHITVEGRIQSREYHKKISEEEYETRTAYEVSVSKINVIEETEDSEDESRD